MRIVHIITRMIVGGAQENTLFNCQDLITHYGDDVLLITGPSLGPEGALLQQGRGVEVPLEVVPSLRRAIHPLDDTKAYFALKRALKRYRPDVVHTHSAKGGFLGRLAAWSLKVPAVIHTVHGAPFHPYQSFAARRLFRDCERYAAHRCHHMISVADAMTDLMVNAGVAPQEKFTTIYSGMDVEPLLAANAHRDRVRQELGYGPDDVVIGKIARLFALKGHDDVIRQPARWWTVSRTPVFCSSATASCDCRSSSRLPRLGCSSTSSLPAWFHRPASRSCSAGLICSCTPASAKAWPEPSRRP